MADRLGGEGAAMIYIIKAGDYIKVGYSKTKGGAYARFEQLQSHNPHKAEIIKLVDGGLAEERQLHKVLKFYRERGEWFRLTPMVQVIIDSLPGAI